MNPTTEKPKFKFPKIPNINWRNPVLITVLIILALFLAWGIKLAFTISAMMSQKQPPATVTSTVVKKETWPENLTAVARLNSPYGTIIKAEVVGKVTEINAVPGQEVKKGDLLMVLDAAAERANARLAELTLERAKDLRAKGVNTQNDLDQAEANYAQAINALNKKEIRAPFDGKVGINQVFVGQYVNSGDPLIAVESLKTMNADFGVPQTQIALLQVGAPVELTVDAYPGEAFVGKISGVDPRVDEHSLNVSVRAEFENPEAKLLSGMFGTVNVKLNKNQEGYAIPAIAVVYSAYGNSVYVINDEQNQKTKETERVARQSFVKLGRLQGDWVLVTNGLREGDEIVTAGQMKLRNGSVVKVDNTQALPTEKAPKPQES